MIFPRFQAFGDGLAFAQQCICRGAAIFAYAKRCADDRRIAGTAAQIALKRCFDLIFIWLRSLHPQRIQGHDDAGCAKAALAAVMGDHRFLYRV